jgi:hypothetical protein
MVSVDTRFSWYYTFKNRFHFTEGRLLYCCFYPIFHIFPIRVLLYAVSFCYAHLLVITVHSVQCPLSKRGFDIFSVDSTVQSTVCSAWFFLVYLNFWHLIWFAVHGAVFRMRYASLYCCLIHLRCALYAVYSMHVFGNQRLRLVKTDSNVSHDSNSGFKDSGVEGDYTNKISNCKLWQN